MPRPLPELVRRYAEHAVPGEPQLGATVRVEQVGEMVPSPVRSHDGSARSRTSRSIASPSPGARASLWPDPSAYA